MNIGILTETVGETAALFFLAAGAREDVRSRTISLRKLTAGAIAAAGVWLLRTLPAVIGIAQREESEADSVFQAGLSTGNTAWVIGELLLIMLPGMIFLLISHCGKKQLGSGDGICLLILGGLCGAVKLYPALTAAVLLSALYSVFLLLEKRGNLQSRIPFLPFLLAGYMCALLLSALWPG